MTFPQRSDTVKRSFLLSGLALALLAVQGAAFDTRPIPVAPDGTRAVVDLPTPQHMRNVGGTDGAGLCVPTSLQHAAYWQNLKNLDGFRKYCEGLPGGSWPQKVDQTLKAFCSKKGVPVPAYIQHEGGDEEFLELAFKTGRTVSMTYAGKDGFYSTAVAHMVTGAHLDKERGAIIDNNRPGEWVWMTRKEMLDRWRGLNADGSPMMARDRFGRQFPIGGGWGVVFLDSPPPPYAVPPKDAVLDEGVFGQLPDCKNGRCPIPATAEPVHADGWNAAGEGVWNYYQGGQFKGTLDSTGWHPAFAGGVLSKAEALPEGMTAPGEDKHLTGVSSDKLGKAKKYEQNGKEVSKRVAFEALNTLTDDSNRWHLTVVGDTSLISRVRNDIAALPSDLQSRVLFQGYGVSDSPNFNWPITTTSLPSGVCLRTPSQARVGAEIACVVAADYTPEKLVWLLSQPGGPLPPPAPPKPMPGPDPVPAPSPTIPTKINWENWLIAAALLAGFWFITRQRKPDPVAFSPFGHKHS
jgi:hypothetical protein